MSVLSDGEILTELEIGKLKIEHFDYARLQPSSYDVLLGNNYMTHSHSSRLLRVGERAEMAVRRLDNQTIIHPGEFILGELWESITLPPYIVARIEGKSSVGRLGLAIHITAGFVDPGWSGRLTLEMVNLSGKPIALYPQAKVAQVSFEYMKLPAQRPYGSEGLDSKYQGSTEVTGAKE